MNFKNTLLAVASLLLTACATSPLKPGLGQNIEIKKVLEQVNRALTRAIPVDPNFPTLTSITLDLQVNVGASVGAQVPINVVNVNPSLDRTRTHRVTLNFVPNVPREPAAVLSTSDAAENALASAIAALYESVANANPNYRLQHTSISLQCTFKAQGTAGLKLVPISATSSLSRQTTQTLTITFGRDPNRAFMQEGAGGGRGTARGAAPAEGA